MWARGFGNIFLTSYTLLKNLGFFFVGIYSEGKKNQTYPQGLAIKIADYSIFLNGENWTQCKLILREKRLNRLCACVELLCSD